MNALKIVCTTPPGPAAESDKTDNLSPDAVPISTSCATYESKICLLYTSPSPRD